MIRYSDYQQKAIKTALSAIEKTLTGTGIEIQDIKLYARYVLCAL